ncbi:hypothetical protein COU80_00460 [Candidatus Peregrinibacteria bacterium CG10_big_fil_rev_8_21_14_0_10_55_24]|nr:MAG: hypothetical protein COU80_00460 [Candidatus Peregrinibacteria bacterium CG10_big_fil_rev_8_21_14_0_10_55_24]
MPTSIPQRNSALFIVMSVILGCVVIGGTFTLGTIVGERLCERACLAPLHQMGFPPNALRGPQFMGEDLGRRFFREGHGFAGEVLRKDAEKLTILDRGGEERVLFLDPEMSFGPPHNPQSPEDLSVGASVMGFGIPQSGGALRIRHLVIEPN